MTAEQFIQEYTNKCSNLIYDPRQPASYANMPTGLTYQPWLTPDQARKAVELAREETIKKACRWMRKVIGDGEIVRDFKKSNAIKQHDKKYGNRKKML